MSEIEVLVDQVEELQVTLNKIKEGKSLTDFGIVIESQILSIVLNNYRETLMRIMPDKAHIGNHLRFPR